MASEKYQRYLEQREKLVMRLRDAGVDVPGVVSDGELGIMGANLALDRVERLEGMTGNKPLPSPPAAA